MKYDGSTDPHEALRDFEHRMVCDGAIDEVKCRAFLVTLMRLASKWFTSPPARSILTFSEVNESFLTELTTSIDNTKHPINLLAVIQRPNGSTRKFMERFNEECKTIDGLTDSVDSLCLTNGLTNDDFWKQLTTKPVWARKEMHVIAKEFIHHEEVSRVVAATKNPQIQTAPRVNGSSHNPRDNQWDSGFKSQPRMPKQKERRSSDRDRSLRLESRNLENHKEEDEEPTMVVGVITGSNTTKKSKSALKKDLKILATVRTPPPVFPTITFRKEDFMHGLADSNSPMVISAKMD
ncbi:hypothetical protein PIB30_084362 [Stylosanthes scabra]|uniref:Retrotransposon gag domain-containing protein n=1 Tax=Stylosanthes scabra TaxID=79078 RepID=A0ABU6RSE1_9FABA|nr:hypothetical protein [Stylosanthes scabra]